MVIFIKNNGPDAKRAQVYDLPEDSCRLLKDEIKGEEEYNEELRLKKNNIDDAPFDFDKDMGF